MYGAAQTTVLDYRISFILIMTHHICMQLIFAIKLVLHVRMYHMLKQINQYFFTVVDYE